METHIEDGKMTCLYELVDGAAGSSHASSIAQLLQISVDESLPTRRVSSFIYHTVHSCYNKLQGTAVFWVFISNGLYYIKFQMVSLYFIKSS